MAEAFEQQKQDCKALLESYKKHLDLPNSFDSITLKKNTTQWKEKKEEYDRQCNEAVNGLPKGKKSQDQVNRLKNEYQRLSQKATQIIKDITKRLEDWEVFQERMKSIEDWLLGSHEEINDISQYYKHLQFFQEIEVRYEKVRKELKENQKKDYDELQRNSKLHFNKQEADQSAGGVSDEQNAFKSKWNRFEQSWNEMNVKIQEFPAGKLPWEKMANLYSELHEVKEDIEERKAVIDKEVEKKLEKKPRPVLEGYQQLARELSSEHRQNLTELDKLVKAHVTPMLISSHLTVRDFVTYTEQLRKEWLELITSTDDCIKNAKREVDGWEDKAFKCIRYYEDQQKVQRRSSNDPQRGRQQPVAQPHSTTIIMSRSKCALMCAARSLMMVVLLMAALSLVILCCLDEYTWYCMFYHMSFIELDGRFVDYS